MAALFLMKAISARHEICWGVVTSSVEDPRRESTGGPGEAGGDAGKKAGMLAERPWAERNGGEDLKLPTDEGGV